MSEEFVKESHPLAVVEKSCVLLTFVVFCVIGRKHPSRDVIFSGQNLAKKCQKIISLHDVLEPLKQALVASRDVIISSQIWAQIWQKVFTLGNGCWLPMLRPVWWRGNCQISPKKNKKQVPKWLKSSKSAPPLENKQEKST